MTVRSVLSARLASRRPLAALAVGAALLGGCAKLDPFGADLGRVHVGEKVVRAPYLATVNYFGHVGTDHAGAEQVAGKPMQPVYVWLPAASPELGVRVVSPSRPYAKPNDKTDFVTQGWKDHRKDKDGLDPTLVVERCASVVDPTDIERPCSQWVTLGESKDEASPQSGHEGHDRAEVRLTSHPEDGSRALVRGIYRVGIADTAHPGASGTFLLQLGAPVYLEGAVMAPNLAELSSVVRSQAKGLPQVPGIGHTHEQPGAPAAGAEQPAAPQAGELQVPKQAPTQLHDSSSTGGTVETVRPGH